MTSQFLVFSCFSLSCTNLFLLGKTVHVLWTNWVSLRLNFKKSCTHWIKFSLACKLLISNIYWQSRPILRNHQAINIKKPIVLQIFVDYYYYDLMLHIFRGSMIPTTMICNMYQFYNSNIYSSIMVNIQYSRSA